jgi:hypothetical protein
MRIESERSEIDKPASELFTFLCNFNNFQKLMPEQVINWQSTEDECTFTIKGMATIGMKIVQKTPSSYIKISSFGKVPFEFTMEILLTEISPVQCTGQIIFESDLNPMMKMMVEKPLTKFCNILADKMKSIL